MSLSNKYDEFYKTEIKKEKINKIILNSWPRDRVEAIVAMGGAGDKILDMGCGNGMLLYQFHNNYNSLIGLEYSEHRLELAKLNLEDFNFTPVLGSAEDIAEIESDTIDCIVSADTIEHIPDVYMAVSEMFRILKPGGTLVINTPNIAFIKKRVLLMLGRFPSTSQKNEGIGNDILFDGGHFHYFTYRSLRIVLEKAGFVMVKRIGYGRFGRIHNLLPNLLSGGVQWVAKKPQ